MVWRVENFLDYKLALPTCCPFENATVEEKVTILLILLNLGGCWMLGGGRGSMDGSRVNCISFSYNTCCHPACPDGISIYRGSGGGPESTGMIRGIW